MTNKTISTQLVYEAPTHRDTDTEHNTNFDIATPIFVVVSKETCVISVT